MELKHAGCPFAQVLPLFPLGASGNTFHLFSNAGYSLADLRGQRVVTVQSLLQAKFSLANIVSAGFTLAEFKAAVVSPTDLASFSPISNVSSYYQAGYTASSILASGASVAQLKSGGYTANQMKDAGVTVLRAKEWGAISLREMLAANYFLKEIKEVEYSVTELLTAGYGKGQQESRDLLEAGYSLVHLKTAGFTVNDLSYLLLIHRKSQAFK